MGSDYTWRFGPVLDRLPSLLTGLLGNANLALWAILIGFAIGLIVGLGRYSRNWMMRIPATGFVEVFRNTPVLVQIMWFYFAFPILSPVAVSSFAAALLGLSLNTGAFSAEIFRGGIQSIKRGQWEAGKALGMNYLQQVRIVILPQAIKRMVPALTNRAIEVFKMTTLASAVAYAEILYRGKQIAFNNFNPIETYTVIALLFFSVVYPMTRIAQRFEIRTKAGDR